MFKIAIVGKTNVGKTTLFNKILRKKISITSNQSGVTIDRKINRTVWHNMKIELCDTAGLENILIKDEIKSKAQKQSLMAIDDADLCLLVVDGRQNLSETDIVLNQIIRRKKKKVILVINKCENSKMSFSDDFYRLGIDEIIYISAEHNIGFNELKKKIHHYYQIYDELFDEEEFEGNDRINIAFVGKPNVGKSTIINSLIKNDRLVTSQISGTTRDSISIPFEYNGRKMNIIDTAGIRKKINIIEELEDLSVKESLRAIDFAHVVVFMIDPSQTSGEFPDHQEKSLLSKILDEGKIVVLIINKWDLIKKKKETLDYIKSSLNTLGDFNFFDNLFITTSALQEDVSDLFDIAVKAYDAWDRKISTKDLNNWLKGEFAELKQPPLVKGKKVKFKFLSQTNIRPPTLKVFSNFAEVHKNYMKFFKNCFADHFNMVGVPIRFIVKKNENPYYNNTKAKKTTRHQV